MTELFMVMYLYPYVHDQYSLLNSICFNLHLYNVMPILNYLYSFIIYFNFIIYFILSLILHKKFSSMCNRLCYLLNIYFIKTIVIMIIITHYFYNYNCYHLLLH